MSWRGRRAAALERVRVRVEVRRRRMVDVVACMVVGVGLVGWVVCGLLKLDGRGGDCLGGAED